MKEKPQIAAEITFVKSLVLVDDDYKIQMAEGTIKSQRDLAVCLELNDAEHTLWQNNISLDADVPFCFNISLNTKKLETKSDSPFFFRVMCNGDCIFEERTTINVTAPGKKPPSSVVPAILGDLTLSDYVDIYTA